jgi:hypothetical protein
MKSINLQTGTGTAFPNGVCPFMSTSQFLPRPAEGIVAPGGQQAMEISQEACFLPCIGEACGVWSIEKKHCSIVCVSELANNLANITASPLVSALELTGEKLERVEKALDHINGNLREIATGRP